MISSARQWCFGLRHFRLCVVLVSREDGFPTDVLWPTSTVVLTHIDTSWILRELLQDCPAFGVHTNTVPDLSLRVHSVCFSEYFIAGSLHLWRLQPARSRSLAFTRILYQQGPEALSLPGFSPLFIIIELHISSFQLPGRLHHPAVADHSSGHIFLLFLVICYL